MVGMNLIGELKGIILSNSYAYALFVLAVFIILVWMIIILFKGIIRKFILKREKISEKTLDRTEGLFVILILLVGVDLALQRFLYEEDVFLKFVRSVIVIVFTFFIMEMAEILIEVWGHHMSTRKGALFSDEVLPLAQCASKILFLLIGLFIILEYWGVQIWTMIASVGVLGIILGLALQDSLSNIFAGISLILDRTFKHGDIIKLESGEIGEVVMINLRSTRIKTFEHYIVSIPNRMLANTKVINLTQPSNLVRMTLTVGVAYDSDVDKVSKILSDAAKAVGGVDKAPGPEVMLAKLNEYSLDFDIMFITHITNVRHIQYIKEQVLRKVYDALKKHKISIPYPKRVSISVPAGREERRKEMKSAREKM